MALVSCLMLTMDRFEITRDVTRKNIDRANKSHSNTIELLVADNGSKDPRIVNWIWNQPELSYHRRNLTNEGCAKSFNQLFLRSKGDYICLLGNDIELPEGWLDEMVKYANGIPNSGIIGMDWGHSGMPPLEEKFGILGHWLTPQLNRVFGVMMIRRDVINKIGFFYDDFDVYGLEDSNLNERVTRSGFNSCYVPNTKFKSAHKGVGMADAGAYREMKNQSMSRNLEMFNKLQMAYEDGRPLRENLPEMKEPV